ncbi:MAG: FAD-dependent monooxygenase [Geobacteraceae bacterium]|nr:FAD-dependent monooxygenase [Geobacteraceae bacterium]
MADADIMVVGAGPVGMLAALLSAQHGLQVLLLEQSVERHLQSRAIGITPPSLEILRSVGLAGAFCEHGVAVRGAAAFGRRMRLGRLDFTGLNSEFRFVLSIPQHRTEALLEQAVLSQPSIRFLRGHQVTACLEREGDVAVTGSRAAAAQFHFSGRYLLACDGGKSTVREALGIPCDGAPDRRTFLMGDFEDTTGWGQEARFFFTARGSVESFPLPDGKRRYVVRTPSLINEDSAGYLGAELLWRAGVDVAGVHQFWESGFGVQHIMARTFCKGRVFLCGDAAHLMSPVGGQNMNTGFADAELAAWLAKVLLEKLAPQHLVLGLYDRVRRRAARAASRRAQCLMVAGSSGGLLWSAIRNLATFIFLHVPLRQLLVQAIGMQSIPCRNLENCRDRIERELKR